MYRASCSIVPEYLELTNGIMALPLNLAILNFEFLDPHLLTISVLLVPALPDAHLNYFLLIT